MLRWLPDLWSRRSRTVVALDARAFACVIEDKLRAGSHEELGAALASIGPGAVDVVVASDVAVHWVQPVPRSLASLAELKQVAAARCTQLFGGKATDWWITGDWRLDGAFLSAGLPRALVARTEEALNALSLRAHWSSALGFALERHADRMPANGWNGMRSAVTLLLWHAASGRIDSVAALRIEPGEDDPSIQARAQQHVALEQMRQGLTSGDRIHWISEATAETEAQAILQAVSLGHGVLA